MSKSEDVQTLFRRFGGNASTYQEVVSRDQVTQAESKWPILGLINPTANQEAPSVRRPSVAPSLRQGQPAAQPQPQPSSVGALAQHHTSSHLPPQPAALVDRPLASAPGGPPPAGMFAALLPAKPASPAQPAVAAMFRPLVSASAAPAPPAHRVEPAPATASVDTRPGAQGGLFNRFKAAMRPAVAVAPVPAPLPAEAVFAPASLPISTAPPLPVACLLRWCLRPLICMPCPLRQCAPLCVVPVHPPHPPRRLSPRWCMAASCRRCLPGWCHLWCPLPRPRKNPSLPRRRSSGNFFCGFSQGRGGQNHHHRQHGHGLGRWSQCGVH